MGDFDPNAWITHHVESEHSLTPAPGGGSATTLDDDNFMHQFADRPYRVGSGEESATLPLALQLVFGGSDQGKTSAMTVINPKGTSTAMDHDGDFSIAISNGSPGYRRQEDTLSSNFMHFTREEISDDRRRSRSNRVQSLLRDPARTNLFPQIFENCCKARLSLMVFDFSVPLPPANDVEEDGWGYIPCMFMVLQSLGSGRRLGAVARHKHTGSGCA